MSHASLVTYAAFLTALPHDEGAKLSAFISDPTLEKLRSLSPIQGSPAYGIPSNRELLEKMHYSWIANALESVSVSDQRLFLSLFDGTTLEKLKKKLSIEDEIVQMHPSAAKFLRKTLANWITKESKDFLPEPLLTEDPLNDLLLLTKPQLLKAVSFLGLYDLATDLRTVVQSATLKRIETILHKDELLFLKKVLKEKDKLRIPPIGLSYWEGDEQKLRNLIQSRGLNRLAKALFYSSPALRWHLMHKFDRARAKVLQKYHSETHDEEARQIIIKQVLALVEQFRGPK